MSVPYFNGVPFERVLRRNVSVSTLVVRPHPTKTTGDGNHRTYRFEVHNTGAGGQFEISASTQNNVPLDLSKQTINLPTDAVGFVDVTVAIPDDPENERDTLFVVATSTRDEAIKSSASIDIVMQSR